MAYPRDRRRLPWLKLWGVAFAASITGFSACSSAPPRVARAPTKGHATLTVMTYNVNYGLAGDDATLRAITDQQADLVLLQETTPSWEAVLRGELGERYPHVAFRHCCGAGGMAVLSKLPFRELEVLEPPEGGWFPAWTIDVEAPFGRLQVMNVHLRPQIGDSGPNLGGIMSGAITTPPIRHREISEYFTHLDDDVPTLIAGDFNESESGRALEYLAEQGFRSTLPEFSNSDTWHWNTSVIGTVSRRFDHIVYGPGLDPLSARVVAAGNSDHLPVVAVFERD